ncbi:N-acetylglucosamine-6-phosphate deacetylase [Aestuariibacter sp. AA17]|uniref:N-acetylgalactosamine-6-phosphate deacetylase n=1 Tax=Fluctibacter corallii TaxID=2984329 RepID=A0ABT3A502_9ALTE|nr:N-acetylglucosamine-6-phosphate deacetylase [Aestuariibacter sp. AA17]MCV2883754.1 N-acetylglucosamine-6-phosphate deacetylase [Aestuariibacter sp. AA17]
MNQRFHAARMLTAEGWKDNVEFDVSNAHITHINTVLEKNTKGFPIVVPGYIDTQVNGGGGVLFNQQPTLEGIKAIAKAHAQYGTTAMLPTLITDSADSMARGADAVAEAISECYPSVLGIHFEGPFLSVAKKGVHEAGFIRTPSDKEIATLTRSDIGRVLVTVAPEKVPTTFIQELVSQGVIVALGHSNARAEQVQKALEAGATGFTHLFNAMSPLTSREPGMVGEALLAENAICGLIIDHHHVHPHSAKLAIQMKGDAGIMLVTDAMAHVGSDEETFPFFNDVIVRQGNKLTTPNGTLAGSCLDMHTAVMNTHKDLAVPLEQSIKMASITPARFLGCSQRLGLLCEGYRADFLVLDESLALQQVWQAGECTWRRE